MRHNGAKKTLLLVGSGGSVRRKVRGATLSTIKVEGGNGTLLGKRIRSQTGRRVGGSGEAKVLRCHLDVCGKIFTDRASLKKHMTVHGDKLVSSRCSDDCDPCSQTRVAPNNTHS